jgi:hypothetical protein
MRRDCPRSADVAAAVVGGDLLRAGDTELHQHVALCESCGDLAMVMSSLRAERDRSRRAAPVPAAGLVWWRAQLRRRQEAASAAAAPVTIVHAITLAFALMLAVFFAWTAGRWAGMPDLAFHVPALPAWLAAPASDAADSSASVRYGLILAASTWLILGPVALYFALRRD